LSLQLLLKVGASKVVAAAVRDMEVVVLEVVAEAQMAKES